MQTFGEFLDLSFKVDEMCRTSQTGIVFESNGESDDWLLVWRHLEIIDEYRIKEPYYNLVIWDLSREKIQIVLETKESRFGKEIIPSNHQLQEMQGTIFKYSF